jgi:hypothetical protein
VKAKKPYYGYKAHIAVDAQHGFISFVPQNSKTDHKECSEGMDDEFSRGLSTPVILVRIPILRTLGQGLIWTSSG